MAEIGRARKALVARVLEGDDAAPRAERRAAFDNAALEGPLGALIRKVAEKACQVTDEDVAAMRRSGLGEDKIFERGHRLADAFGFVQPGPETFEAGAKYLLARGYR
jgi:hypothetical protein